MTRSRDAPVGHIALFAPSLWYATTRTRAVDEHAEAATLGRPARRIGCLHRSRSSSHRARSPRAKGSTRSRSSTRPSGRSARIAARIVERSDSQYHRSLFSQIGCQERAAGALGTIAAIPHHTVSPDTKPDIVGSSTSLLGVAPRRIESTLVQLRALDGAEEKLMEMALGR